MTPPARSNRVAVAGRRASLALALIATAVIALRRASEVTPAAGPAQFTIAPPENTSFGGPAGWRNRQRHASGGVSRWPEHRVRRRQPDPRIRSGCDRSPRWRRRPIPGTEGGAFPFWSPDSRSIGFFADGKLKKVQIAGGPPIVLCDAPARARRELEPRQRDPVRAWALPDGPPARVERRRRADGRHDPRSGDRRRRNHRWPHFLPDGRHFFYTATTGPCCPAAKPSVIRMGSLDPADGDVTLFQAESSVSYASGHVLFARDETLMAQPFDPRHASTEGRRLSAGRACQQGGKPLRRRVRFGERHAGVRTGGCRRRIAVDLVRSQPAACSARWATRLRTPASRCHQTNAAWPSRWEPEVRKTVDIWIIDIARNVRSRLTFDPGRDVSPVWSPDGTRIAFQSTRSGKPVALRQTLINGTARMNCSSRGRAISP